MQLQSLQIMIRNLKAKFLPQLVKPLGFYMQLSNLSPVWWVQKSFKKINRKSWLTTNTLLKELPHVTCLQFLPAYAQPLSFSARARSHRVEAPETDTLAQWQQEGGGGSLVNCLTTGWYTFLSPCFLDKSWCMYTYSTYIYYITFLTIFLYLYQ